MKKMKEKSELASKLLAGVFIAVLGGCVFEAAFCPVARAASMWSKTYGGTGTEIGTGDTEQTVDGGYAVSGDTNSFGAGGTDFWLFKTDSSGNMLWGRTYGGLLDETCGDMCLVGDGGFALAGNTRSFGAGGRDVYLVKTDSAGNMMWNKTYGGAGDEYMLNIIQTSDSGYMMSGYTASFGAGGNDAWLVKTDSSGVSSIPRPPIPPSASAFTNVKLLPGWTWNFFVHCGGGAAPYTFQWYEGATLLQGQTSMLLSATKTTAGTYTFYCRITDARGATANSNNVTLTVMS